MYIYIYICVCTCIQIHRHNLSRIVAHLAKPLTHGRPHPIKNLTLQSITRFCPRLSHHTHSGNGFATDTSLDLPTSLLLVIATKQTLSTVQQGYAGWRSYGMQGTQAAVHIHTYTYTYLHEHEHEHMYVCMCVCLYVLYVW